MKYFLLMSKITTSPTNREILKKCREIILHFWLDRTFCSDSLLHQIEANGDIQFAVGDKSISNHWLESITYPHNVGEPWKRKALFIQFRRGPMDDSELVSKDKKCDKIYIGLKINNQEMGFICD